MKRLVYSMLALIVLVPSGQLLARGKNKIKYDDFEWRVYRTDHFKIFYYEDEAHMLAEVADMVEASYKVVSEKLQHQLGFPVPFIFFKTHEEFEQTNIFPGFIPRAVGAFAEPYQSRMVLPLDNGPEANFALITHELTHIFQYDMLYNNKISTIIRTNTPTWFTEGMASYVADDEDNLDRMILRDAALNSNFGGLGAFSGFSFIAYRIGHAAFAYMEDNYGIEGVRNFLWQYRKNVTGSVGAAIERAFEIPAEDFDRDFRKYLRKQYVKLLAEKEEPDDYAREIRTRNTITTLSPELSPSGDLFAAIVPVKNEIDVVLISTKDGRVFKNLTKGYTNRYLEINVGAFGGINDIAWNPDGNEIAFTARKESTNRIYVINVLNGNVIEEVIAEGIRDAQSPIFSGDGKSLFFVGNQRGFYDIWRFDRESRAFTNLTKDEFHDRNPRLSPDGNEVLYSSQRKGFYKIFALNLSDRQKTQLTSGLGNDIQASYSQDMTSVYFSSDRYDDIHNIFELDLETGSKKQYTDVLTGAFSPQERVLYDHKEGKETRQLVFTAYYQGRYRVYRMDKPEDREEYYDVAKDNYANVKNYDMSANLQLDPERYTPYRPLKNFSISNVNVNAGVTDDGRFISNSGLTFSDVLGDHLLNISVYSVSSLENYAVGYLDRSRRFQWGANVNFFQEFFVDRFFRQDFRVERISKNLSGTAFMRFPLSLYSRVDAGVGYTVQDSYRYQRAEGGGFFFSPVEFNEPLAYVQFSRDSVRYQSYGPQQGMLFDLRYSNTLNQNQTARLDFRAYRELTKRSLLAMRTIFDYSDGDTPTFFSLGGTNYLRGDFGYQEFVGSRRFLSQFEVRFPVLDQLRFPGFALSNIRGALFVETGSTWFEQSDFNWEFQDSEPTDGSPPFDPENPNPDYLLGAYGLEVSLNFLGLELHWTWAKRTNFDEFPSDSRFSFWIGRKF